ncbi:hypothetical protein Q6348_02370 [Isoptericola sp. b441]|uniref:Excreted virulence factor EspC (Type VII ESX diderm) n=1 Tax=Actinotalea lenta TaxID=3064654 RepID=A0ABT9D5H2_9CELL|nr:MULTISPECIES: hypothetical protein [unclassified Isoptericola]MDO8106037.1 hypothetical protein [Isoptericola sp. b441]MDO8122244.1 hypothetical protein [Isoptericola sp. b490]
MTDLVLDTTRLRETGAALRRVALEFEHANARSSDLSPAIGHDRLAACVRGFAYEWDDRRERVVAGIQALAEACTGIGDGFEELDTSFVTALKGEG